MTALLVARLVDAGKLTFETTLADALPDVPMRDAYRPVTVAQLLTFTGGIQPYTRIGPRLTPVLFEKGTAPERRKRFIEHLLQEEPVVKPGTAAEYSNASYALVAFVASRRTGRDYRALMEEYVFRPLGMTRAGLGRPRSKERPNEPWLHLKEDRGYVPEPDVDRPPEAVFEAAGGVHCSIRDFARFAAYELAAARGKDPLLKPPTARRSQELVDDGRPGERALSAARPGCRPACCSRRTRTSRRWPPSTAAARTRRARRPSRPSARLSSGSLQLDCGAVGWAPPTG
jgi:CubicO group peptidase (beta-lactamase class C family)